jgi:hypothetical protein
MNNKQIWKYEVLIDDNFKIEMPSDSELLSVQMQGGEPKLWVLCDPKKDKVKRKFRLFGTGHEISGNLKFVGTFQYSSVLVFHLFEEIE